MKFVMFYHSLVSDWNHGNAHFLRGVVSELLARGHEVEVFEPEDGWSRTQLVAEHGSAPIEEFERRFPRLSSRTYDLDTLVLEEAVDSADVVLVHEWNDPALVAGLGRIASKQRRLLFHDTHHRAATAPQEMARYDLSAYDGVLAFGEAVRQRYLEHFEEIRHIQRELVARAESAGVPVVRSFALDRTVEQVAALMVDAVSTVRTHHPRRRAASDV
ncbi:MAG: hypothetical protein KY442_12315 [Proteobacteria bacterium]|nr:hypothetical protein [Pseudomonadota bacterium]